MKLTIIGGFSIRGKIELIHHVILGIHLQNSSTSVRCILSETEEDDFSSAVFDSDIIQFSTLVGGCPCCSHSDELERLFLTTNLRNAEYVIMDVPGICDLEQLVKTIKKLVSSALVQCYQALEAGTVRSLLVIAPVLRSNLNYCEGVAISDDEDDIDDAYEALKTLNRFNIVSPKPIEAEGPQFVLLSQIPSAQIDQ